MRRWVLRLHLATALVAGPVFVLAGLSGAVIALRMELREAVNPAWLRVEPRGEPVPLEEIVARARAELPGERLTDLRLPERPDLAYEAYYNREDDWRVYLHPYTGEVLGKGQATKPPLWVDTVYFWHKYLLSGKTGKKLLLGFGSLFFLHCLTGAFLWWPTRSNFVADFLRQLRQRRLSPALLLATHRLLGGCLVAVFLVVSMTGVELVYRTIFHRSLFPGVKVVPEEAGTSTGMRPGGTAWGYRSGAKPLPWDELLAKARETLPGYRPTTIEVQQGRARVVVVNMEAPEEAGLYHDGRSVVHLDPYNGHAVKVYDNPKASFRERIFNTIFLIHSGRWGGWPTRLAQLAFGFFPLAMYSTGLLAWRRLRKG